MKQKWIVLLIALALCAAFYPNPAVAHEADTANPSGLLAALFGGTPSFQGYAGSALSWTIHGPSRDAGDPFSVYYWGGADLIRTKDGLALIAAWQWLDDKSVGTKNGGRLVLQSPMFHLPGSILVDVGWLDGYAIDSIAGPLIIGGNTADADAAKEEGALTFGGGLSWPLAKHIHGVAFARAIKRGDIGTDLKFHFTLALVP